ncbi:hypothetical protein [Phenylobacterium sp. NIBR 498073]|uniref:hypothetical protein n=1 Tax=Phenylobacterium sp. NIBR 498073 TaxID=3015177 RepID=UPI0022B5CAB9|nr:hypothetical protein [Phenylobacterium sp. NIBR 498073]WGU38235.1 hypothetical protein O4N75_11220 [Phenylobacterium sp. NIBR 498073]
MKSDGVQLAGEVVYFSPRVELSALENLAGFIALARDQLTIFGRDLEWDAGSWDVTATTHASGLGRTRMSFSGLGQAARPMAVGIGDFARAYLRYQQGLNPIRGQQQRLAAFRALDAVGDFSSLQDVTRITPLHLDAAVEQIASHYSETGAYRIASQLEAIGRFLSDNSLVAMPFQWTHSLCRPSDTVRIGREYEDRRARKLPSQRALEAVAFAFRAADNPSDRIAAAAERDLQLEVRDVDAFHDRFIDVDGTALFHVGTSLKDAGRRAFMISRLEAPANVSSARSAIEAAWARARPIVV